jgi:hypothetical protein
LQSTTTTNTRSVDASYCRVVSHRAGCCILCGILAHKVSILAIICGMVIVGAFIGILTTLPFNCEDWREKYDD